MTKEKYYNILNLILRFYEGAINSYTAIDDKNEEHWRKAHKENGEILREIVQLLNEEVEE